jgi:amino acid transporter
MTIPPSEHVHTSATIKVTNTDSNSLESESDTEAVTATPVKTSPPRSLGLLQLVGMLFLLTSGGGYGLEPIVGSAGPRWSLLALIVAPWLWALPQAMMASELATLIPEDGGYVIWVEAALGPFWGFQQGWWSFVDSLVDNALFPRLFSDYTVRIAPAIGGVGSWLCGVLVLAVCTLANIVGLGLVGWAAVLFTIIVVFPFLLICVVGFPKTALSAVWQARPLQQVSWRLFLAALLWNWCGFDSCSTVAGEIRDVHRTFPRAMVIVLVLTTMVFTLPIAAAVTVNHVWSEWRDAFWPTAANRLAGGHWLGILVSIGGMCSAAGMLSSLVATSSRALYGMTRKDMLPAGLGVLHQRFQTPWICIAIIGLGSACFTALPFNMLIQIDSTLYCLKVALEFLALAVLRKKWPDRHRPFRIGGGIWGLSYVVGSGLLCCLTMAALSGLWSAISAAVTIVSGLVLYLVLGRLLRGRWVSRALDQTVAPMSPEPPS